MVLRANAAAVLTALMLMPALMVLLRSSSVCSSDEKRQMRACDRIPACTMELGGDADCEGDWQLRQECCDADPDDDSCDAEH